MMAPTHGVPKSKRTRVSNACRRCRKHKTKCSGTIPCKTCSDRQLPCGIEVLAVRGSTNLNPNLGSQHATMYAETNVVPEIRDERFIHEAMSSHHDSSFSGLSTELLQGRDGSTPTPASSPSQVTNPMVPEQPAYMMDRLGNPRYLGHSSTFSFSRQLLSMIQSHNMSETASSSTSCDAEAHTVNTTPQFVQEDFTGLPSAEVATFYMQAVKFRTEPLFYLFDELAFTRQMQNFYEEGISAHVDCIWYVHYLLVVSLGKALTTAADYGSIAGADLFDRALRLLPDNTILWRDLLTAIETMCCISLYLFSIDHRSAGYIYLGQALRMAHVEGLHTNVQESNVGQEFSRRGRQVWWTVYSLDRRFSTSMGLPNSLREEDITSPFPEVSNVSMSAMGQAIHVGVCQLLGRIIRTVYSADGSLNKTFLKTSQEVLRGIGGLASELEIFQSRCVGDVSRVLAHLSLSYHQCIILCTRPFLMYLIKRRLETAHPTLPLPLSRTCKGIVQACVDSAARIPKILSQLRQHQLLDDFLPFDLECGFSSGLVLTMAKGIHPKLLPPEDWLYELNLVFDYMTEKGNVMAGMRKAEIQELARVEWNGQRREHRSSNADQALLVSNLVSPGSGTFTSFGDPFFDEWGTHDGLSGAQLVSLADALDFSVDIDLWTMS